MRQALTPKRKQWKPEQCSDSQVLDALPVAVLVCAPDGEVLRSNAAARRLLPTHAVDSATLRPWAPQHPPDDGARLLCRLPDGRALAAQCRRLGDAGWVVQLEPVSEPAGAQDLLQRRLDFERTVVAISAALMRVRHAALDSCIDSCLGALGQFFGVDRCYLFRMSSDGQRMSNTHEWVAEGVSREAPNLQNVPARTFPWLLRELRADRTVAATSVAELPDAALAERTEFEREGIQSIVLVPIPSGASLWGFAGFDAVSRRIEWTEDFELGLRLTAKMLANALQSRELSERLTALAFHDPLTGLANRALLEDRLRRAQARARRNAGWISLLLIDLDDFKQINDDLGHAVGDQLLCEVARRLEEVVRDSDTVARLGGDEFVLLLEKADEAMAQHVAERALESLGVPWALEGCSEPRRIGASIGLACARATEVDAGTLLREADRAMYVAKYGGKNRIGRAPTR
jgi:diguanylate cyclase (GGDEF)-like protein